MITELLFLIIVLWIWSGGFSSPSRLNQQTTIITRLTNDLRSLSSETNFTLIPYSGKTYTSDKKTIYLNMYEADTHNLFDYPTLLQVGIHELAHLMCPEIGHTDRYWEIENRLYQMAVDKDFLDGNEDISSSYPCQET